MHLGGLTGAAGQSLLVESNVAAIAILIGYGMADLTLQVAQVLLVLGITLGIGPDILMTVLAFDGVRVLIPGGYGLVRTVKFLAVALGTDHALPGPVDITRNSLILAKVLGTNAGTVAGNTVVLHGRSLAKLVSGNKAPAHLVRPADMTLPARRVALLAVTFKGRGQRGTFFQIPSPGFKDGFKTAERRMEADIISVGDVLVAGIAITFGRVAYQSHVGQLFFLSPAVTTVTDNTANLPVGSLNELGILQEDLLPYLQRR